MSKQIMNKILMFSALTLLFTYCTSKTDDNKSVKSDPQIESVSAISNKCEKITGKWEFVKNNDETDYMLEFYTSDSDSITGYHCFIRGAMGDQMDCSDEKITFRGLCQTDNILKGTFNSSWDNSKVSVKLEIVNDTLQLIKDSPDVSMFFQKEMRFVKE